MINYLNNELSLTSGRAIRSSQWSLDCDQQLDQLSNRCNSLSIHSSDAESVFGISPTVSPFGSPVKYSPYKWSESVANDLSTLESQRIDSKDEFDQNGIEVPLLMSSVWKPIDFSTTYELFGKNKFTYAKTSLNECKFGSDEREGSFALKAKQRRRQKTQMYCGFCKNNNETPDVYNSHICKNIDGKTVCPVLRKYDCPVCHNGGGNYAHTIRYCPQNKGGQHIPSVIKVLKNSRSADGKKRNV